MRGKGHSHERDIISKETYGVQICPLAIARRSTRLTLILLQSYASAIRYPRKRYPLSRTSNVITICRRAFGEDEGPWGDG